MPASKVCVPSIYKRKRSNVADKDFDPLTNPDVAESPLANPPVQVQELVDESKRVITIFPRHVAAATETALSQIENPLDKAEGATLPPGPIPKVTPL